MAVYTDVSDEDLSAFIASYDVGTLLSCKGIAEGIENTNYFITTDQAPFILTLYEKRVKKEDLPFFMDIKEHLASKGINCPQPIKDRKGVVLKELSGRPAAMISFLNGMGVRRLQPHHCRALGEAMAEMHLAGQDFEQTRKNNFSIDSFRTLFAPSKDHADEIEEDLADFIEEEIGRMEKRWPTNLPTGLIHADLFPDNVFFLGQELSGIIDFYFACTDALAYDFAICLNAWCFEPDLSFNVTKARHMLAGYQKVRPFTKEEKEAIPLFARGSAMRFLLTRLHDWLYTPADALVVKKDPREYLMKLRFHQSLADASIYGLGDS